MTYTVKEMFLTVQGEGMNIGRPAVFIRFSGCNLWSGREADRAKAVCKFCDTQFVGGTKYADATQLGDAAHRTWGRPLAQQYGYRFCVLTGGEPLLQVDNALISDLHKWGFYVAVETNGTKPAPAGIDWVCVSPKAGAPLVLTKADELKLVYPQIGADPEQFDQFPAKYHWLSPMDGPDLVENTRQAAAYCLKHPQWRLAIQAHKTWGIP